MQISQYMAKERNQATLKLKIWSCNLIQKEVLQTIFFPQTIIMHVLICKYEVMSTKADYLQASPVDEY